MYTDKDGISSFFTLLEETYLYGLTTHIMHRYESAPPLEPPPFSVQIHTPTHKHTLGQSSSLAGRAQQGG